MKVVFFGTNTNYIQNPGSGAFFVKINTYGVPYTATSPTAPAVDISGLEPATDANVIDGGVTVANVMNQSIQITTKVLETMQFSVGTVDPDTLSSTDGTTTTASALQAGLGITPSGTANATKHGVCDPILTAAVSGNPENVLPLGNQDAESSLEVAHTYGTHSYWRLSSNSSAGATVYYSGHTLSNTEGDQIKPIGATAAAPHAGTEQFGLAIDAAPLTPVSGQTFNTGTYGVDYTVNPADAGYVNGADNGLTAVDNSTETDLGAVYTPAVTGPPAVPASWDYTGLNASYHTPRLDPLVPEANYGGGSGAINGTPTTSFAFDPTSDTVPVPIASESSQVVDCVTAKMRYIANIAATTPAGIYTTKINYIAAPQY